MSEFVNTIDQLGDETALAKMIDGSLTEFKDNLMTKLRKYMFYNYTNLVTIDLPNSETIGSNAFNNCSNLMTVNMPNVLTIGAYAFDKCTKLANIDVYNVTTIANCAFENCQALTTLDLPNLTSTGYGAFSQCKALTTVNIPNLTTLSNTVFCICSALKKLDLPKVTNIESQALAYCTVLDTLILRSETMATLANTNAFSNTPIASGSGYIYVPRALIDSYKTASNWSTYAAQFRVLEDYTVDGTITGEFYISDYTRKFVDGNITYIKSDSITNLPKSVFQRRVNLEKADFSNLSSIKEFAFDGCSSLTALILRSDKVCTITDRFNTVSQSVFRGTPIISGNGYVYVKSSLVSSYQSHSTWKQYQIRAIEDYPEVCGGV